MTNNNVLIVSWHFLVDDVFLSHSSVPSKGVLQVAVDKKTRDVCFRYFDKARAIAVCRSLGYKKIYSLYTVAIAKDAKDAAPAQLSCHGNEMLLSQCGVAIAYGKNLPELTYIECKYGAFRYWKPV